MKRILFLSLLLSGAAVSSQTVEWFAMPVGQENNNGQGMGYTTACDPAGNPFFLGFKQNPYNYNDTYGDVWLSKYDTFGEVLFSKTLSGKVASYAMACDSEGSIFIALSFIDEMTINETTLTHSEVEPVKILMKLDDQGNLLWYKALSIDAGSGIDFVSDFRGLTVDSNDNIYAAFDNYMNSHIVKYSPEGEVLLDIEQQNANRLTSVAVDDQGNIYGAGACAGPNAVYAGVPAPTDLPYNTYIVKYTPSGVFQWIKYIDDITCPDPQVVAKSPNEVYMSSFLFTNTAFDAIEIEGPMQSFEDFFVAKLNEDGDYQWVREVPGQGIGAHGNRNFMTLDNEGNVYFSGYTGGSINWASNAGTSAEGFGNDAFIIKYSPDGEIMMAKCWGGESHDRIDGISINTDGDIFAAGIVSGTGSFGGFEYEGEAWEYKPFLAKIAEATAGIENPSLKTVTLYPNPATDVLMLQGIDRNVKGRIYNSLGQQVMDFSTDGMLPVNVGMLPAGTYFIKAEGFIIEKFMKK